MSESTRPLFKTCSKCKRFLPITSFYPRKNRPGYTAQCAECQKAAVKKQRQDSEFMARTLAYHRQYGRAIRLEVLRAYGGNPPTCACCGERELVFLALDHVDDNGGTERQQIGQSHAIFRWLRRNGFPPGYQVLCHNCNWGKRMGGCPHTGFVAKVDLPTKKPLKAHCLRGHPFDEANTYWSKRGERHCRACQRQRRREERRRAKDAPKAMT